MDFRTEWWSKILVLLMIVIAVVINPWIVPETWNFGSTLSYVGHIVAHPLIAIALSTIPVVIICWIMKIMPDLDYSIWLAFAYMLYLLIKFFV